MVEIYTPGSFTKNFSWNLSFRPLHAAIVNGFSKEEAAVTRPAWRANSGVLDADRQLIPLNFFLYSREGIKEDFVLADQFVEVAIEDGYNSQFAQLALFVFHSAISGKWRNSPWSDGRVAGWANDLIRETTDKMGNWSSATFSEANLMSFLNGRIEGQPVTIRKIFTNYRFMLASAGVLRDGVLQAADLRQRWLVDAVQIIWDRKIFERALHPSASDSEFEDVLIDDEIYKLLRCSPEQCRVFARAALREYSERGSDKLDQLRKLQDAGKIAA